MGSILKEQKSTSTSSLNTKAGGSYGGVSDAEITVDVENGEKIEMIDCNEDESDRDSIKTNRSTKCDKYFAYCCAIWLTLAECFGCLLQIACCCGIVTCFV